MISDRPNNWDLGRAFQDADGISPSEPWGKVRVFIVQRARDVAENSALDQRHGIGGPMKKGPELSPPNYDGSHVGIEDRPDLWPDWVHRVVEGALTLNGSDAARPEQVQDCRGYAHLGTGQYLINHSASGEPAELCISIATEDEKAGRVVGDSRDNAPGNLIQPESMVVRLRFENVDGLDALEHQIRLLRQVHFPCPTAEREDAELTTEHARVLQDIPKPDDPVEGAKDVEALAEEGLAYFERAGDPGDKKYVDAIRAILRRLAAKPQADQDRKDAELLDFMKKYRIGVTPEMDGPWNVEIYDDDGFARCIGSSKNLREALTAAVAAIAQEAGNG